jgi:hypothetical protein
MAMRVTATAEAAEFIGAHGGQLFVWPAEHRSARLALAVLEASVDPPPRALDFRRVDAGGFLLFLHPALTTFPEELLVVLRGRRHPRVEAFWDGLAYIVL